MTAEYVIQPVRVSTLAELKCNRELPVVAGSCLSHEMSKTPFTGQRTEYAVLTHTTHDRRRGFRVPVALYIATAKSRLAFFQTEYLSPSHSIRRVQPDAI
jgi:hypothetical protein